MDNQTEMTDDMAAYIDDTTDQVNDRIADIVQELTNILHDQGGFVRPHEAALLAAVGFAAADASAHMAGDIFLHPLSSYLEKIDNGHFVEHLSEKAAAGVLLNMQITAKPGLPESGVNKRLALEAAERLGPDWAQALYHFSVLVTKLA